MLAREGSKREPSLSRMAKATEVVKNLKNSREELSGVGSMGCCESRRWNRRCLIRSEEQSRRNRRDKLQGEILRYVG
jgi:hypothetical protein